MLPKLRAFCLHSHDFDHLYLIFFSESTFTTLFQVSFILSDNIREIVGLMSYLLPFLRKAVLNY